MYITLNKNDYNVKIEYFLNDKTTFQKLAKNHREELKKHINKTANNAEIGFLKLK